MRIIELKCDQFAGLHDRDIRFEPGMNLLIGPNESGKSTLADLLYQLFFHDNVIDKRRDRNFIELYFPKTTSAYQADTIDGTVRFEGKNGTYRLYKDWSGKDGSVRLSMPDGVTLRDPEAIGKILAEELSFGKGVYDELVFPSQKREATALRGLFSDGSSETDEELASLLARAVMETGGVDLDRLEDRITQEVASYEGRWDSAADLPEGGRSRDHRNPWKVGRGLVLDAYYEMRTVEGLQEDALKAEMQVEALKKEWKSAEETLRSTREKREQFSRVQGLIHERKSTEKLLKASEQELTRMDDALRTWPRIEEEFRSAESLKEELLLSEKKELYRAVQKDMLEYRKREDELEKLGSVDRKDITEAERLQRDIIREESRLSGLRLTARVRKLGDYDVEKTVLRTGEKQRLEDGELDVDEAVEIRVPGVVSVELVPKGINPDLVRAKIGELKYLYTEILTKNRVSSVDALREKQERVAKLEQEREHFSESVDRQLAGQKWETLRTEALAIPEDQRPSEKVKRDVLVLAGRKTLDLFIGEKAAQIRLLHDQYESPEKLKALCEAKDAECMKMRIRLSQGEELPEEFQKIGDPDAYDAELKTQVSAAEKRYQEVMQRLSRAESDLGDRSYEEYSEELRKKQAEFEEKKAMLTRWKHIREVFLRLRGELAGDPMTDVEEAFRENLRILSGGSLTLESLSEDLKTSLVSGNHPLTYATLSEGTKDTVLLAFRLAVLEHLYPEGGALAVFDDPFTDMDPERTAQACRLLQAFAEKNQVIFISCDEKYEKMLSGNVIREE